ncbi:MAG TPA: acyl-CoA dehydrogenase family protein [Dermatophilaceae bacterium]|nr:acyl-CoA dehydrogenase family protein [Dermatophilaceae bacterium]
MPVSRLLPTEEAHDLLDLVRDICAAELAPVASAAEAAGDFPRETFRLLGRSGLLGLPYPEELGGAGLPYQVYLQVLEEIAASWMSVAVGVSVHGLSCYPLATYGTPEQQQALLPQMLAGAQLGAYCLSETQAGSDVSAIRTRAVARSGAGEGGEPTAYRVTGTKAWVSHAAHADFYTTFVRTDDHPTHGLSCLVIPADTPGLSFAPAERKMGLHCDPVRQVVLDDALVDAGRMVGKPGMGMPIALSALDSGRLGIAAAATGLAQAALDLSLGYAREREQFGRAIAAFQGVQFMLADMQAATTAARSTYLYAAQLRDAGRPFTREAAVAKLVCTDAAMRVTTDAVQILGGYGYTQDFPAERYMREAKVTQIFEGTNQIQRVVIARQMLRGSS